MARITQEMVLQTANDLFVEHGRKIKRKELTEVLNCSWSAIDQIFETREPLYKYVETPQEVQERHKRDKVGAYRVDPNRGYPKVYKKDGGYIAVGREIPPELLERAKQLKERYNLR
jgi:hypothetical protein